MEPMHPDPASAAEALLSQSDWVRALVRGLGVDASGTDDVLQSTWVAALSNPPRAAGEGASLRAWIARVARNFALRRLDREHRRSERERRSAREERLPSTAEIVEREEARAQVVRALLEVHEPFRTTLLLRFYEGLEPRDIARMQHVPDSTVRNRLKRGLVFLRERLEAVQGPDWRQRCLLVLPALPAGLAAPLARSTSNASPLTHPGTAAAASAAGGALVIKSLTVAAAVGLAAGGLYLAWDRVGSKPDAPSARGVAGTAAGTAAASGRGAGGANASVARAHSAASSTQLVASTPSSVRAPAAKAGAEAGDAADPSDDGLRCSLRGQLLTVDGAPLKPGQSPSVVSYVAGTGVNRVRGEAVEAPQGLASLDMSGERVVAAAGGLSTSLEMHLQPDIQPVVEPGDPSTAMEETQQVTYLVGALFERTSILQLAQPARVVIASAEGDARQVEVDSEGRFEFGDLRPGRWRIHASAGGFVAQRSEFEIGREEREKHLSLALSPERTLPVRLLTPEGRDLIEAVTSDPDLAPEFVPVPFATREPPGLRVADLAADPAQRFGAGAWRDRTKLDPSTAGDASGALQLCESLPLHVGVSVRGTVLEERLVPDGAEAVTFVIPLDRIRALATSVSVRVVSAQDGLPIRSAKVEIDGRLTGSTDANGLVGFSSVPPGRRELRIEAEGTECLSEWIDVEPGAHADLGVRTLCAARPIRGRVLDEEGKPVRVDVSLSALDGRKPGCPLSHLDRVPTDAEGRFEFLRAGRRAYTLSIEGEDWAAPVLSVDARSGEPKEFVLNAARCGELELTFPVEPPPGAQYLVDTADGIPVALQPCEGWGSLRVRLGHGQYAARIVHEGRTLWARGVVIEPGQMMAYDQPGFGR